MDWQKKVSLWWAKNFRPLVVALLVGCGVHYTIYANQLGNFDAVHIGALYTADGWPEHLYWETQQGRWALRLVDMLRGGINQPALSALLMLFLYALAGVLLTDLFAVRSRVAKYLIPLTLVCAPYVAEVETYHYCSVSYALSFLLAVLAVRSAVCGVRFVWLMGTVCLAFALGMYQANLGTAAGLCVMLLLLAVLRRPRRMAGHRPDCPAHGVDGRQRCGAVYADFKIVPAAVRCGPIRHQRYQHRGNGDTAQSAVRPEKRLL